MSTDTFQASSDRDDVPFWNDCDGDGQPGDVPWSRHCFVCCEMISDSATECPYCGIDLTASGLDALAHQRKQVAKLIAELEDGLQTGGPARYRLRDDEAYANLAIQVARNLILAGVLLLPFLVGAIPIILGAAIQHRAIKARDEARLNSERILQLDDDDSMRLSKAYSHLGMIDRAIERLQPA